MEEILVTLEQRFTGLTPAGKHGRLLLRRPFRSCLQVGGQHRATNRNHGHFGRRSCVALGRWLIWTTSNKAARWLGNTWLITDRLGLP
ncbi:hypothetical protein ACVBEG_27530 [Pseudomonas sp. GG8]